jgi:hypothetical protein
LVPVVRVGKHPLKEPALNRRKRDLALNRPLLNRQGQAVAHQRCQLHNGLVLKELPGGEHNPRLPGPGDHLDAEDGISP